MTGVAAEVGSTANNYQILARLAIGGMAEIFLARGVSNTGVERYVVLKRILRERATDVHFVRMFLDEARLAAQLQHPNVAQVYDTGRLGDSYFFTMEYVHGETVPALLHRARSLRRDVPLNAVLTVITGAASGLHHAHDRLGHDGRPLGIVHRDVSPSNLMISYEGTVKVVDFGVAKAENRAQETRSGTVKGKIAYLSPEQCRGGAIDRRSDLFSLGIVFWEMLTTERLYKRPSDFDNMTAIVTEAPVAPSTRRKDIPPELDRISLRLLAKDPNARFESADELVEALEEAGAKTGTMISSSALGRFMRELFGQRPEPWLELDSTQQMPVEGVTITSEPLPSQAVAMPPDALDEQLGAAPKPSEVMTSPAMPVASRLPLAPPPPSGVVPPLPGYVPPQPPQQGFGSSSGSYPVNQFGSTGSQNSYPIVQAQPPQVTTTRSWPLILIVAAAAVIGSLTVWVVMRSGSSPVQTDAAVIASARVDAAVVVEPVEVVEAVEIDASVATTPDAGVAAVAVDAAVVAVAVDAAVAAVDAVDALEVAMTARRYGEVVALCNRSVTAEHAVSCVVAACATRNEAKARAWLGKAATGSLRRAAIARCRDAGLDLNPPKVVKPPTTPPDRPPTGDPVVDKCAKNPMACQR